MFNLNNLYDQIVFETRIPIPRGEFENLMRLYILPSFNRDYPHAKTISIQNKKRFYPLLDLTGYDATNFISHIFIIKQDRIVQNILSNEFTSQDIFYISSTEIIKRILSLSYKSNSYTINPVILFDGDVNSYFYELNPDEKYILVFLVMNNLVFDYDDPGSSLIFPSDFNALKAYSM